MRIHPHPTLVLALAAVIGFGATARAAVQNSAAAPAAAPKTEFQAEYDALLKEFQAAQQAFFAKFEDLKTDEERSALFEDKQQNPNSIYAPRFRALAERAGTSEAAGSAWMFLLGVSEDQAECTQIVSRVMKDFLHAPAAEELAQWLRYGSWQIGRETAILHLRALDASRRPAARAAACFSLANNLMSGTVKEQKEARSLFERIKLDFAATRYAGLADNYLFELDNLQVGMTAPEIVGLDSQGQAFKLSDYRGQVVVLDFWGFW